MIGTEVLGFRIEAALGEGFAGPTFRATGADGQPAVVTVLDEQLAEDPWVRARFAVTARALLALRHPGLARVLAIDVDADRPALVTEALDAPSLYDVAQARGAMPVDDLLRTIHDIGGALGAAHGAGLVHHALTLDRVLFPADGVPRIVDLGLAAVVGDATRKGAPPRISPRYRAPEQVLGLEDVDRRADIHALGLIAWELATGRLPFADIEDDADGDNDFMLRDAQVRQVLPDVRTLRADLPDAVAVAIARALEKEPSARFPLVSDLLAALSVSAVGDTGASAVAPVAPAEAADPADAAFRALLDEGAGHLQAGRLEDARRSYERSLALRPGSPLALNPLGLIAFRLGAYDEAAEIFSILVEEDGTRPAVRMNLGLVLLKLGRIDDARREFEAVLALDPDHPRVPAYLAAAWEQLGDLEKAIALYEQAGQQDKADELRARLAAAASSTAAVAAGDPASPAAPSSLPSSLPEGSPADAPPPPLDEQVPLLGEDPEPPSPLAARRALLDEGGSPPPPPPLDEQVPLLGEDPEPPSPMAARRALLDEGASPAPPPLDEQVPLLGEDPEPPSHVAAPPLPVDDAAAAEVAVDGGVDGPGGAAAPSWDAPPTEGGERAVPLPRPREPSAATQMIEELSALTSAVNARPADIEEPVKPTTRRPRRAFVAAGLVTLAVAGAVSLWPKPEETPRRRPAAVDAGVIAGSVDAGDDDADAGAVAVVVDAGVAPADAGVDAPPPAERALQTRTVEAGPLERLITEPGVAPSVAIGGKRLYLPSERSAVAVADKGAVRALSQLLTSACMKVAGCKLAYEIETNTLLEASAPDGRRVAVPHTPREKLTFPDPRPVQTRLRRWLRTANGIAMSTDAGWFCVPDAFVVGDYYHAAGEDLARIISPGVVTNKPIALTVSVPADDQRPLLPPVPPAWQRCKGYPSSIALRDDE